jgi:tetratricopeptide (TPR) repeat protein
MSTPHPAIASVLALTRLASGHPWVLALGLAASLCEPACAGADEPPPSAALPRQAVPGEERLPLSELVGAERFRFGEDPAPPEVDDPNVPVWCDEAREALNNNRPDVALTALEDALKSPAGDVYDVHILLARAYALFGQTGAALDAAQRASELRPSAADAHFLVGTLRGRRGELDEATWRFRAATLAGADEPDRPSVTASWYHLGRQLEQRGFARAALDAYERFDDVIFGTHPEHRLAPEIAPLLTVQPRGAFELRLDLLWRLGESQEALRVAREARERFPQDRVVSRSWVQALLEAGAAREAWEFCRARAGSGAPAGEELPFSLVVRAARAAGELAAWLREALENADGSSGDVADQALLAERLLRVEAYAEAQPLLQEVAGRDPANTQAAWRLAVAQSRGGDLSGALGTLARWCRTQPQARDLSTQTLFDWFDSRPADGNLVEVLDRSRRQSTTDFASQFALGMLAAAANRGSMADTLLAASLTEQPDLFAATLARGHVALREYRWNDARQAAEALLARDPASAEAHYLLAAAHEGVDENEAAEGAYRKAAQRRANDPAPLVALARLLRRTGDALGAQRYYQEALSASPSHGTALEDLIDSYLEGGKIDIARARLEKAQSADVSDDVLRRASTTVRFAQGPTEELVAELRRQAERHPDDLRTLLKLTAARLDRGELDLAAETLAQLRALGADDEQTLVAVALIERNRLAFDKAVAALETLAQRHPRRGYVLGLLAEYQLYNFQPERSRAARARLLQLAETDTQRAAVRGEMLDAYAMFGEFDAGLRQLEEWEQAGLLHEGMRFPKLLLLIGAGRETAAEALARELTAGGALADVHLDALVQEAAQVGQAALAERILRDAHQRDPSDPGVLDALLTLLADHGKPDQALALLESLPDAGAEQTPEHRVRLARARAAAGDAEAAVREIEALLAEPAVQFDVSRMSELRAELVFILGRARQFERALRRLDEWMPPASAGASLFQMNLMLRRMALLQEAGRVDEYLAVGEKLLDLFQEPTLASLWVERGEPLGAAAAELRARYAALANDLGYTWVDRNENLPRGLELVRRAVAVRPMNAAYLDSLGWAYYKSGDFAAAREWLARAARLKEGQDAVIFDHWADAEYRAGARDAAREHWRRALELTQRATFAPSLERQAELAAELRLKLAALERSERPSIAPTADEAQGAQR